MTQKLISRAYFLAWFTIGYNLIEGMVSIFFGISDDSIALAGFGFDSLIEVSSAFLVLWRLRQEGFLGKSTDTASNRERTATLGIGALFLVLATTTILASGYQIYHSTHPDTTLPGTVISLISLSFMFWLWYSKRKLAAQLDSSTLMKDADCSLACIKLSIVLLVGSLLFFLFPSLSWIDSAAAIVLALFIGKEGIETVTAARSENFSGGCGCGHK